MTKVIEKIGYIGIGHMGGGIARHMAETGVDLTVYDLNPKAVSDLVGYGAKAADSLKNLVDKVDIIFICVVNDAQVEAICLGPEGILAYARKGQAIVIQSTVKPSTAQEVGEAAAAKGVGVLDGPVSGDEKDKLTGSLTVFVGGEEEVVKRCRPILDVIGGDKVTIMGRIGSGQVAKLCNNMMHYINILGVDECLKLARAYDIPESKMTAVARSGDSWALQNHDFFDNILREHELGRHVYQIVQKDLRDAIEAAKAVDLKLPVSEFTLDYCPTNWNERADYLGLK